MMQTSLPPGQEEVYQFHGHGRQDPEASPIRRVKRPNSSMGESPRAVLGNLVHNKVRCNQSRVQRLIDCNLQLASPFGRSNPSPAKFKMSPVVRKSPKRKKSRRSSIGRRVSFSCMPDEVCGSSSKQGCVQSVHCRCANS